jgi:hypothetical protein
MHDGGTNLALYINNKLACDSAQFYNRNGTVVKAIKGTKELAARDGPGHGGFDGEHIISPGACVDYGTIKKGDVLKSQSYYDFDQFKTMAHNGKNEALMGNCRIYIGPE